MPVVVPIGREEHFRGIIDLVRMKAIFYNEDSRGARYHEAPIPSDKLEKAKNGVRF